MRLRSNLAVVCLGVVTALCRPAWAWGPEGHQTVGALADRLLAGTVAAQQVRTLLDGLRLEQATVWADCAKGVRADQGFTYPEIGVYRECAPYETEAGRAAMSDYVRRNDTNCDRASTEESCHKQYHYANVAVQHGRYEAGLTGTREHDVVAAITAAINVLRGEPAPAPFDLKDKREALLLLAHLVGDLHQPLHVGAIYLDARGRRVDPRSTTLDPAMQTRGGNLLALGGTGATNLHARWDAVPGSLTVARLDDALIAHARAIRAMSATPGPITEWPTVWATDSVRTARQAFAGVRFGPKNAGRWRTTLPSGYATTINVIKREQAVKAGAHLAELLQAIWP